MCLEICQSCHVPWKMYKYNFQFETPAKKFANLSATINCLKSPKKQNCNKTSYLLHIRRCFLVVFCPWLFFYDMRTAQPRGHWLHQSPFRQAQTSGLSLQISKFNTEKFQNVFSWVLLLWEIRSLLVVFFSRYLYLKNATSIFLKIDCKYTTIFGTISCLKCVKHSWTQVWNFKLKFFYNLQETTHTVPKIILISPWKSSLSRLKHLTRNFSAFCDRNMCAAQLVNNSYPLTRKSALAVTGSVFMPQFRFFWGECALICFQ